MRNFEEQVLGSVFLDQNRVMYIMAKYNITCDSFITPEHKAIFTIIQKLAKNGKPIDLKIVAQEKPEYDRLLEQIIDGVPTAAHAEHYIKELKDAENKRVLLDVITSVSFDITSGVSTDESINVLNAAIMSITNCREINIYQVERLREEKIEQWRQAQNHGFVGVPFSLQEINAYLGGWRKGVMGIIAGYRGEGKSTLIRQEAVELAGSGVKVGLFSLEDPPDIACACMAGNVSDVSTFGLDTGTIHESAIDKINEVWANMNKLPLWIAENAMSIEQIISTSQLLKMRHGIDILFIDHIQFISPYTLKGCSRNDTVAQYSGQIIQLAKKLDIPIVCASQLSRDSEKGNRKPRLSDLRDSGTLEQDARQILLLYYDSDAENHILEVAKNNYGQSRKEVAVRRLDGRQRFEVVKQEEDFVL